MRLYIISLILVVSLLTVSGAPTVEPPRPPQVVIDATTEEPETLLGRILDGLGLVFSDLRAAYAKLIDALFDLLTLNLDKSVKTTEDLAKALNEFEVQMVEAKKRLITVDTPLQNKTSFTNAMDAVKEAKRLLAMPVPPRAFLAVFERMGLFLGEFSLDLFPLPKAFSLDPRALQIQALLPGVLEGLPLVVSNSRQTVESLVERHSPKAFGEGMESLRASISTLLATPFRAQVWFETLVLSSLLERTARKVKEASASPIEMARLEVLRLSTFIPNLDLDFGAEIKLVSREDLEGMSATLVQNLSFLSNNGFGTWNLDGIRESLKSVQDDRLREVLPKVESFAVMQLLGDVHNSLADLMQNNTNPIDLAVALGSSESLLDRVNTPKGLRPLEEVLDQSMLRRLLPPERMELASVFKAIEDVKLGDEVSKIQEKLKENLALLDRLNFGLVDPVKLKEFLEAGVLRVISFFPTFGPKEVRGAASTLQNASQELVNLVGSLGRADDPVAFLNIGKQVERVNAALSDLQSSVALENLSEKELKLVENTKKTIEEIEKNVDLFTQRAIPPSDFLRNMRSLDFAPLQLISLNFIPPATLGVIYPFPGGDGRDGLWKGIRPRNRQQEDTTA